MQERPKAKNEMKSTRETKFGTLARLAVAAGMCVLAAGCANYSWRPNAPQSMRTVAVPVFRNESSVTGLGSEAARAIAREFQREGTFAIARQGEAALEIQGVVKDSSTKTLAYSRSSAERSREQEFNAVAVISVIDKTAGKVLVDNRRYEARTTFLSDDDLLTGSRDAAGRLAEDFARQVVDDVTAIEWDKED